MWPCDGIIRNFIIVFFFSTNGKKKKKQSQIKIKVHLKGVLHVSAGDLYFSLLPDVWVIFF